MKENKTNNKNSSKNNHIYSKNCHNYSKNNNNNNNNNDNNDNDNNSFMVETRDQALDAPKNQIVDINMIDIRQESCCLLREAKRIIRITNQKEESLEWELYKMPALILAPN